MKYRIQSANVLNEADRFQRILDVQLFSMEQDNRIWGYNPDVDWYPGEPLYKDPRTIGRFGDGCTCEDCEAFNREMNPDFGDYFGNHVRPMIQLLDDGTSGYSRCKDCEVSWRDGDDCWVCGKTYERRSYSSYTPWENIVIGSRSDLRFDDAGMYATFDVETTVRQGLLAELGSGWAEALQRAMSGLPLAAERAAESMRGITTHMHIMDEFGFGASTHYGLRNMRWGVEPYHPPTPPPNPFEREERPIELVPPVVPNLPEVIGWNQIRQNNIVLPPNWAELRRTVPLPEMPEPKDFSKEPWISESVWNRINPPLTNQRRPR